MQTLYNNKSAEAETGLKALFCFCCMRFCTLSTNRADYIKRSSPRTCRTPLGQHGVRSRPCDCGCRRRHCRRRCRLPVENRSSRVPRCVALAGRMEPALSGCSARCWRGRRLRRAAVALPSVSEPVLDLCHRIPYVLQLQPRRPTTSRRRTSCRRWTTWRWLPQPQRQRSRRSSQVRRRGCSLPVRRTIRNHADGVGVGAGPPTAACQGQTDAVEACVCCRTPDLPD